MRNEKILNNYYNKGRYNHPSKIGYMMKMIRELRPLTEDEWKIWYMENIHDESYLNDIAETMAYAIQNDGHNISKDECLNYIYDVMFRRTFGGFNKEKLALNILRDTISPDVQESSEEWDSQYFIDFYLNTKEGKLIGIQLKPETFYHGNYQHVVNIKGKMESFCNEFNARSYVLIYKPCATDTILFKNPEVLEEIKKEIA